LASRQGAEGVGGLPDWEMASKTVSRCQRGVAIGKTRGNIRLRREVSQFLDQVFADESGVPARAGAAMTIRLTERSSAASCSSRRISQWRLENRAAAQGIFALVRGLRGFP